MFEEVFSFLGDKAHQKTLSWLGGGLVVAAGGVWVVVKYFWPQKKASETKKSGQAAPPSGNEVLADRGSTAVGGNFSIDNSTHTKTGLDWVSLGVICAALLGAALIAVAFVGNTVTAEKGGVAAGGDIQGSTINIGSPSPGDSQ